MYPYVYIQNQYDDRNWYLIIRENDEELLSKSIELWEDSAIKQLLNGRAGLSVAFIAQGKVKCIESRFDSLNEGEILLINRNGGHMFLSDSLIILKEVKANSFPIDENNYINGILSPDGVFKDCDYGHHYEITQGVEDDENQYITISQDEMLKTSSIFIGDNITDKQKDFLLEHLSNLSSDCIQVLKSKNIL